jgi:hypothetical protein
METFAKARDFVDNPQYAGERREALASLDVESIDEPIAPLIDGFAKLRHCFTLQSCYGHFVWRSDQNDRNLDILPEQGRGMIRYRIAYIMLCIENSPAGRKLRDDLEVLPDAARGYIQFGSPGWIWKQYLNSFALQVEPQRYCGRDEATLEYAEAFHVQKCRDVFFAKLRGVLDAQLQALPPPREQGGE